MTIQQPNDAQRADILHVLKLAGADRTHHTLDFSDERQYRYAVDTLILAGKTPDRYPGLHEMLGRTRDLHVKQGGPSLKAEAEDDNDNVFVSGPQITNAGLVPSNVMAGMGYHTQIGGTSMTQVVCQVLNSDTAAVLASGSNAQYNAGEFVPVQTNDATALAPSTNMTASVTYFYQLQPGQPMQSGVVSLSFKRLTTSDPVVTQPVQKPQHASNPYIIIGLARGLGNQADVDYWFWQNDPNNFTLAVPLVGNVQFDAPIQQLNPGTTINLFFNLAKAGGGQASIQPNSATMAQIYQRFSISNTNNQILQWNLPATNDQSTTYPVIFGQTDWAADTVTYFTCNMTVNLVGQPLPSYASIMSVDNTSQDPIDGTAFIKPIQFVWHCLAQGTGITMADGSTRKIEDLVGGEIVRVDNKGGTLAVRATFAAPHRGPAVKVTMADGKQLVLSQGHVVVMADGSVRLVQELSAGDSLTVLDGTGKVATVEQIEHEGILYNLSLGSYEEAKSLLPDGTTMFANGVLVGDHQMQTVTRIRRKTHPEAVRAAIDPIFLKDYESHLKEPAQSQRVG
jgi:hypothetical protein